MAQIIAISGSAKRARMTKSIHKATKKAKVFFILPSKDKPRTIRKVMISPLVKKWSNSFIISNVGQFFGRSSGIYLCYHEPLFRSSYGRNRLLREVRN